MIIAIWTKSPPKIEAIKEAIKKCVYFEWKDIEIIAEKVDSWISDMPTSLDENILWAQNRAKNLKKNWINADLYIWMEWWTTEIWNKAYLFWVVWIMDNSWNWHIWISPMMQVPNEFHRRIYENWEELWPILTEITQVEWASQKTWAFWHWSDDMLTR
jgi:non-canonical (house-cleaning) NTP pyrophosphatase